MIRRPRFLYDSKQVRELDRIAIEDHQIDGYALMCLAGKSAYKLMRTRWPAARRINVLCGSGNNGGDGYVLATLALKAGLNATVTAVSEAKSATALQASQDYQQAGGQILTPSTDRLEEADVLVDAILGTGLTKDLSGKYADVVRAINDAGPPVFAIDIPSGLNADSGGVMGVAVEAKVTITFIGAKIGLFTGKGPSQAGDVVFDDLNVPDSVYTSISPLVQIIMPELDSIKLPKRDPAMHKGLAGRVLVAGGGKGMAGAARMAAEAAYRCGAGLVQVATHRDHVHLVMSRQPEIMAFDAEDSQEFNSALSKANVVAVGPGLGRTEWAEDLLLRVLTAEVPLVVDADALNLVAERDAHRENWILTPHPGEAARLSGVDPGTVQADRVAVVQGLKERYGGVVVLKGAGTLVNDGGLWLCSRGNPGMASGGMGDVLTGIVSGLVAQGQTLSASARYGVWIHAVAADRAARAGGQVGLLATDILPYARQLVNE
ncbi:MAG: NAD(P)H-hydrate dehydratase [Arenicellales bacterium]|nr:NAD(P)H-hydrate dehydratase [Arenicellales bacterium]